MKRRTSPPGRMQCTLQRLFSGCSRRERFARGVVLLLLLLTPQRTLAIWRPPLLQSTAYRSEVLAHRAIRLSNGERFRMCAGGGRCFGCIPPLTRTAPPAALCSTNSFNSTLLTRGEGRTTRRSCIALGGHGGKRNVCPSDPRNNGAKYRLGIALPSRVNTRVPLPHPGLGTLNYPSCLPQSSTHLPTRYSVSSNSRRPMLSFSSRVSHCRWWVFSTAAKADRLMFALKLEVQHAAVRCHLRQSPVAPLPHTRHFSCGCLSYSLTGRCARFSPPLNLPAYGVLKHLPHNFSQRLRVQVHNHELQSCHAPASSCGRGKATTGFLCVRRRCCSMWVPFSTYWERWGYTDNTAHRVDHSQLRCSRYLILATRTHLAQLTNDVRCAPLQYGRCGGTQKAAEMDCLLATKKFARYLQTDSEDVASTQDAEQEEQEAFERMVSQVESQLRMGTGAFTAEARNPSQRPSLEEHDCQPGASQQVDQHQHYANPPQPTAKPGPDGPRKPKTEQQHDCGDGERLSCEHPVKGTAGEQAKPRHTSTVSKRYHRAGGTLSSLKASAAFRAGPVTSPQIPVTDHGHGEESYKETPASTSSLTLLERLHNSELCPPGKSGSSRESSRSSVAERRHGALTRHIRIKGKLLRLQVNGEQLIQLDETERGSLQEPLQNGHEQHREAMIEALPGGHDCGHNNAAASEGDQNIQTSVHGNRPLQFDGRKQSDPEKRETGGDEGGAELRDRQLSHWLLQSNSVSDIWRLLHRHNIQLIGGAGLVDVIHRLAFLCATAPLQTERPVGRCDSTLEPNSGRVGGVDTLLCGSQRNKLLTDVADVKNSVKLQVRAELKRHPIFKDIINALPAKVGSLRVPEAATLLHALAKLRIRPAPELLQRTGTVIAAKAFGMGPLVNVSEKSTPLRERLNDVTLGRLWASVEMFPPLQHHPLREALTHYTINRLKAAPERSTNETQESAFAGEVIDSAAVDTQGDGKDSRKQDPSTGNEHREVEPIATITAAVIAKAAVQMRLGPQSPDFVRTLQSYVLRHLVEARSEAVEGAASASGTYTKRVKWGATSGVMVRLLLSLANLKKQQDELPQARGREPLERSPVSPSFTAGRLQEQTALPAGSPPTNSHTSIHEGPLGSLIPNFETAFSDTKRRAVGGGEEEDAVFLQAVGAYFSRHLANVCPAHEEVFRLLKALNYFYWSLLSKLQLRVYNQSGPTGACKILRSSVDSLTKLLVAAAVIIEQKEDGFDNVVGLADLLINLNSLLQASKALRKMTDGAGITYVEAAAQHEGTTGTRELYVQGAKKAACLAQKVLENEWRRGEEFVQSVLKSMAERVHVELERLHEQLRRKMEAHNDLESKDGSILSGTLGLEETSLAPVHRALLEKSQALLDALLTLKCTGTGDRLVDCVRMLVGFCDNSYSFARSKDLSSYKEVGYVGKKKTTPAASRATNRANSRSQSTVVDSAESSASTCVRVSATQSKHTSEEEVLRWRRHLLDGSVLLRMKAMRTNRSVRRAVSAANTVDQVLSAVMSGVKPRLLPASCSQITGEAARAPKGERTTPTEEFQDVKEIHADSGAPAASLDVLTVTSALHRLALLQQQQQHDDYVNPGSQNVSQTNTVNRSRSSIWYDPRMHILLQAVASKIPRMGQPATRVIWALGKLHYFDQRHAPDNRSASKRLQGSQQSSLHARDTPALPSAQNGGIQNNTVTQQAFFALRRDITLQLLQRLEELIRAECLSGSELSATLHVLAGKGFSSTVSDSGSPDRDASTWAQHATRALQSIRRSVASSLLRGARSLSGLDASVALYSLAVLGWAPNAPCRSPSLIQDPNRTDSALSESGRAQEGATPDETRVHGRGTREQHKADSSATLRPSPCSPRKAWESAKALENEAETDSKSKVSKQGELGEIESLTFYALLQRLTQEMDNCNVQTLVVALWAVAITAGRRQESYQGQTTGTQERKEERETVTPAVSGVTGTETCPFGRRVQTETFDSLQHDREVPPTYEKLVWLSPEEKMFLAAVREKLENQVTGMGRASLSMLLLSALIIRWRQPRLLLNAIRSTLDTLRRANRAPTAEKVGCSADGEGVSSSPGAFLFHGSPEVQKAGELHSRVWAILAMLQQQLLFASSQTDTPARKIRLNRELCNDERPKEGPSHIRQLWQVKRQAAVQLKGDLEKSFRTTGWVSSPQRNWAIQHIQSLLLSCVTMEEDLAQQQQQLGFQHDLAAVAEPPTSSLLIADDTGTLMQEIFFLLERLAGSLLSDAAAHVGASVVSRPEQPKRGAIRRDSSAAQSEAQMLLATNPPGAPIYNTEADTDGEAGGSELRHQRLKLTDWVKRLSLLLFALRRMRQIVSGGSTQKNCIRETTSVHSFRNQAQDIQSATLPPHDGSTQQHQAVSSTETRQALGHNSFSCPSSRHKLLAATAQLLTVLLRCEDLRPSHPQLPSLFLEFRHLLADSTCPFGVRESGQSFTLSFAADLSRSSAGNGATESPGVSDAHTWHEGTHTSVRYIGVMRNLGEALVDWVCLHLEETDDRMYNAVLPLVQMLGAQGHLLSKLHRVALKPVKESVRNPVSELGTRTVCTAVKPSRVTDAGTDRQGRGIAVQALKRTQTILTISPPTENVPCSRGPLLRRSRAASLALMLHHRHRIAFHPSSMHMSLIQSATGQTELLASFPSDAAHALSVLQRWKTALGRGETDVYPELLGLEVGAEPSVGARGQKNSATHLCPSGGAPVLTAAAVHDVLRSRSQLLVSGLSQPHRSTKVVLQSKKSDVSTTGAAGTPPTVDGVPGVEADKPLRTCEQKAPPSAELFSSQTCENQSPKCIADSELTQWDMLSLPQLVHASTAAAQLLELPSAEPAWMRAQRISKSLVSGVRGAAASGFSYRVARTCQRVNFNSESLFDSLGARKGQSTCGYGLAAAAAALTRYLLQQRASVPSSGLLATSSAVPQGTDSIYKSGVRKVVGERDTVKSRGLSYLQNNAGNHSARNIPRYVSTHTSAADQYPAEAAPLFIRTQRHCRKAGDCGGRRAVRRGLVAASSRGWARFRAFVKARRNWLAAAGALRLLGGGDNLEQVTRRLADIAWEIADLLRGYTDHAVEVADIHRSLEQQGSTPPLTYSDKEGLRLINLEEELSVDEVFSEEEDSTCAATCQPAVDCMANSDKYLPQRNWGTTLEKQKLVLVQQLACSYFEEIAFQLRALHARSVLCRRRGHSSSEAHLGNAAQAMRVSAARIFGALASAPVLPINAAALLLQPCLAILGTGLPERVVGSQQEPLLRVPQKRVYADDSSLAEEYTSNLTMLLRRLLPLAPQWAPLLGSHRAVALFLEIAEHLESARLCEPHLLAQGGRLPNSGLFCLESAPADAVIGLSDSVKHERREDQKTSVKETKELHEGDGSKKRKSRFLQAMLLSVQKMVLSQARCTPGRMARFWRALAVQAGAPPLQREKLGVANLILNGAATQAAGSTLYTRVDRWNALRDRAAGPEGITRCEGDFGSRFDTYQAVLTEVIRFLEELAASAVEASQADVLSSSGGSSAAHSDTHRCATFCRTAATLGTAGMYKVDNYSDRTDIPSSSTVTTRKTKSVEWIYGAVAAAGSGLLGDSAQQRIATVAAQVSAGTAAYFAFLSFLANCRGAPVDATVFLVQMLTTAARVHILGIREACVTHDSSIPAEVKGKVKNQDSNQHSEHKILQRGETVAEVGRSIEGVEREKVTALTVDDAQRKSTRLPRLAKAAWMIWVATTLQQHTQGEGSSGPPRRNIWWDPVDLQKSADEQKHSVRATKQALEESADAVFGLLQEEAFRLTNDFRYPSSLKGSPTDKHAAAATSAEVYRLLVLALDTAVKMYSEDDEDKHSRRLFRIEATLTALTSLINASIHASSEGRSNCGFSQLEIPSFLSFPSLPSVAYILHLVRQARVYYAPLIDAISSCIQWHRHNAPSTEGGPTTQDDTSGSPSNHPEDGALHELPRLWDGGSWRDPTQGRGDIDVWPSLLLLADAATYQPQEALKRLKREVLLFVEPLLQGAPLSHIVRILRFCMNATPITDFLSLHQRDQGSMSQRMMPDESAADILVASKSPPSLQAAEELKARNAYDTIVHRCMTEGAPLLLKLRPSGRDWSGTMEEQLAELEAVGYAPVGLIDTLNKIHVLHTLSKARTGDATAAEKKQWFSCELMPEHLERDSLSPSFEREVAKRTGTKRSLRNVHSFSVPSENSGWWPQILRWIAKYYIGKRSSGLHKAVSGVLSRSLRVPHRNEVWTATGLSLDIVLDQRAADERRIAVEVDGPTHYVTALGSSPTAESEYQNSGGKEGNTRISPQWGGRQLPTALTQFKRQLLEQTGWHVVSIPFFEWTPPSRTVPATPDSWQTSATDSKKHSRKQVEPPTLARRNASKQASAAGEEHYALLVAAKLRALLTNSPFDVNNSKTTDKS